MPKLHLYQEEAVRHLHRHDRAALFMEMGLGKTASTLTALTPDHLPALVTAPKRVAENVWETERRKWRPDLTMAVAAGTPTQRHDALLRKADVTVIGRDNLKDAVPFAGRFKTFVLDELSGFKNRGTARWKAANAIQKKVTYVWGLTGTPTPNGLLDLWAQIYLLDQGERLSPRITDYRGRYFMVGHQLPSGVITEWNLRPGAEKRIHRLLEDICLAMEADGRIDLPPVVYNDVVVPMLPNVRQLYKKLKDDLVVDLEMLGEVHTAGNGAILSNRLRQLTAGAMYVDDADLRDGAYDIVHRERVRAAEEIVDGTGSPVLIFYQFQFEKDMLLEAMPYAKHIDDKGVMQAWDEGRVPVMLAHPAGAGHGLNLQYGGHTIIWVSRPWSLEEWEQGNARLARQGQKHSVVIHCLTTPGSTDQAVANVLEKKMSVQDALKAHLESVI